MVSNVFLALGSNLGDRENILKEAIKKINGIKSTKVLSVSRIYETEPVGYLDQDNFLNMVIGIETGLIPAELLYETKEVENLLKRTREIRWGPRTVDIDILLYGTEKVVLPDLVIPHPAMFERAFVLVPLKDVYHYEYVLGRNIDELIAMCGDKNGVKLHGKLNDWRE